MRPRIVIVSLTAFVVVASACGAADPPGGASVEFDASAQPMTFEFEPVPPGTYRVDTLGTPFSLTIGEDWFVQKNHDAFFVVTHPDSFGPGDRDVVFIRPTALFDPADPAAHPSEQQWWSVDDIDGWLDTVVEGVVVSEPREVTLGGRDALTFDLELSDDFECGLVFCAAFVDVRGLDGKTLSLDTSYRVWWVDDGDHEPITVVAGGGAAGTDFFATADTLLTTVAFGASAPHPIPDGDV